MRKFRFKLEAVRQLREQEEQAIQVELAAALRERAVFEASLTKSLAAEQELYRYLREGTLSAPELEHISRYGEHHRRCILDSRVYLRHHDRQTERIRMRLAEARAKREALDKLEANQRAAHRAEGLAEEARELDEIAGQRYANNMIAKRLLHEGAAA
jgi:flagellar export protein FliJ